MLGCTVLVPGTRLSGDAAPTDLTAIVLAAGAAPSYAAYSLIGGPHFARGHPSNAVMGVLFGSAGLLALPLVLFVDMQWFATARGLGIAVYLALFVLITQLAVQTRLQTAAHNVVQESGGPR